MAKVIKNAIIAVVVVVLTIYTYGAITGVWGTAAGAALKATLIRSAWMAFIGSIVAGGVGIMTAKAINATAGNFGTKLAGLGAQVPRQIVYGKARVGGIIAKMDVTGDTKEKLHLSIILAGHEVEELSDVHFGDIALTTTTETLNGETVYSVTNDEYMHLLQPNVFPNGILCKFTFHDGSQTAVDGYAANNLASRYPATCKFQGMAYVYMEIFYDPEFMAGIPNIWFTVKGKKVYDPRNS